MPVATWYSSGWNRWWVVLGDQRDVDVGALERLCRGEAAEARPDDDDLMPTLWNQLGLLAGDSCSAAPDEAPLAFDCS